MDIALCLEQMGIPADVSPDLSSYTALADNWRGDGDVPPETDFVATWNVIKAEIASGQREKDEIERSIRADPFKRAWIKRQAKKEGKTPRQVLNEILDERSELP